MTWQIGASASRTKTFTDEDVRAFAQISGDGNAIHLDDDYAKTSVFGQRIAHGMLTASLISALIGNDFPGTGTIYLSQDLKFKAPVFIGDTVTATVEIVKYRADRRIMTLHTVCAKADRTLVIEGEAVVIAPYG